MSTVPPDAGVDIPTESTPLLSDNSNPATDVVTEPETGTGTGPNERRASWWRRPTPTKLLLFIVLASLSRGLTLSPRIDVYTHLACSAIRHENTVFTPDALPLSTLTLSSPPASLAFFEHNPLPSTGPSKYCISDPRVQAAAASLQTILNTSVGVLSALTAGFWGSFSDRMGRKYVVWLVAFGFMAQDLVFVFCAVFGTQLHLGQYTLLIGSFLEGIFGSWAAFNGATNSYISDCSLPASRARKFALFSGLFFVGVSLGPALGSAVLHLTGLPTVGLFYIAVAANALNLLQIPLLIPESLSPEARKATRSRNAGQEGRGGGGYLGGLVKPLAILSPRKHQHPHSHGGKGHMWDVDLTLLGVASFCGFLLNGIAPNKYLYAEHMFGWNAPRLGYYITTIASCRGFWLIVCLPAISRTFRPKHETLSPAAEAALSPSQRRAMLLPGIQFDLRLARISVFVDVLASLLTCLATTGTTFTVFSTMSSFGGGALPSMQSLMVALFSDHPDMSSGETGIGGMFGAISMLQAVGQNIMGPLLFGEIYIHTVAYLPQAIFASGACLLFTALISLLFVSPHRKVHPPRSVETPSSSFSAEAAARQRRKRGRSRTAKDLRRPSDVSSHTAASSISSWSPVSEPPS